MYSWENVGCSVMFGIFTTLLVNYVNTFLVGLCIILYKYPDTITDTLIYATNECTEEDVSEWNTFYESLSEKIYQYKTRVVDDKTYLMKRINYLMFYVCLVCCMNAVFGIHKMGILLFWMHLFACHPLGNSFCSVFHNDIFSPLLDKLNTEVFLKVQHQIELHWPEIINEKSTCEGS